jgi:hypothetical protein
MSDFPAQDHNVTPLHIPIASLRGPFHTLGQIAANTPAAASMAWTANLAVFMPMSIPFPYPVRRVWWFNGSAATTNVDFGIYNMDGVKVLSTGSTVASGVSTAQFVDVTDFLLGPGRYYFAWAADGTTNDAFGWTAYTTVFLRLAGVLQQSTAFPLPATMASAGAASAALLPLCGISRSTENF